MTLYQLGTYVWGTITCVLALGSISLVVLAGVNMVPDGTGYKFSADAPHWLPGIYTAVKDNGSLMAGILAFSGLAWAGFFKAQKE